ncbi:MAG: ParB/RepB/Spo0J family partition protein [Halanaerobiales bacterium]|nr:ParB/RepB/Spo0J family partition protein [Halanaerobiales bacterium]
MDFSFFGKKESINIKMIDVDLIRPNPHQPRSNFDQKNINQLAKSIENFGIIQPLVVSKAEDGYTLIAGERRLRAAKQIDYKKVPVIINQFKEEEIAELSLVENIQRVDLNFLDEALAYYSIINKFDIKQTELAKKLGKSQSTIANKLRILNLPEEILALIREHGLTERHARALLKVEQVSKQEKLIIETAKKNLSVRELIKKIELLKNESLNKNIKTYYNDLRLIKNTLNSAINQIKSAGVKVVVDKEENKKFMKYSIKIIKTENK